MAARRTWTDEELKIAVANAHTATEVIFALGLKSPSSSYSTIAFHVKRLGLDTSHFRGQGWRKGAQKRPEEVKSDLLEQMAKRVVISKLRNRLIEAGLKEGRCEICGIAEWMGKTAPLQVDHKDGDRLNNKLANLRLLCANCHMQTETWGFRNARRRPSLPL